MFELIRKFSAANEEIMRKQILNDIANYSVKEKGVFGPLTSAKLNNSFLNGPSIPMIGTPLKQLNNLSFDEEKEEFFYRKEKMMDALQTLNNPSIFWANNGIAYEMRGGSVSQEKIRKKLDMLLYNIDRRLKQAIASQMHEKTSFEFAHKLHTEIVTLSSYLEHQQSRIALCQVIEVNLESLLMVKKQLIELALKTSKMLSYYAIDMFVMDFARQPQAEGGLLNSPAADPPYDYLQESQKMHRALFSEFLKLASIMLDMAKTPDTLKLLNEVLVFDELWQESVKTFTISLFLSDLCQGLYQHREFTSNLVEDLGGVNLVTFDEVGFIQGILPASNMQIYAAAKEQIYAVLLNAQNIIRYYNAVAVFFKKVVKLYFVSEKSGSVIVSEKQEKQAQGNPD